MVITGSKVRIPQVSIFFIDSRPGGGIGTSEDDLDMDAFSQEVISQNAFGLEFTPDTFTLTPSTCMLSGCIKKTINSEYGKSTSVFIRHVDPTPCQISSIYENYVVSGEPES